MASCSEPGSVSAKLGWTAETAAEEAKAAPNEEAARDEAVERLTKKLVRTQCATEEAEDGERSGVSDQEQTVRSQYRGRENTCLVGRRKSKEFIACLPG